MARHSSIELTDITWNPVTGWSKVSPLCCEGIDLGSRISYDSGIPSSEGITSFSFAIVISCSINGLAFAFAILI